MIAAVALVMPADPAPDSTAVTSCHKAPMQGKLVQTRIVPPELGNSTRSVDYFYTTPEAAWQLEAWTLRLLATLARDRSRRYALTVPPEYRGRSLVTTSLTYVVQPDGERLTIKVW